MVKLKDIVDIELFKYDLERGMILESLYPEDNSYAVYTYSRKAQFEGYWNPKTTLVTRGLVVKKINKNLENAVVIARGMNKFFTVDQHDSEWGKLKLVDEEENVTVQDNYFIDFNAAAYVSDKIDGALGIAIPMNDDYILITKGSFVSDEALIGNKVLHTKHDSKAFYVYMQENYPGYTPLFEIVTPEAEHVIDYGDYEDIVFLGLVNNATGKWYPNIPINVKIFDFKRPEYYGTMTLGEALSRKEIDGHEGLVITLLESRQMYKLKYEAYLEMQSLLRSLNKLKEYVDEMRPADIVDEKPLNVPELVRDKMTERAKEEYYKPIKNKSRIAMELFALLALRHNLFTSSGQKEFAREVEALKVDSSYKKILFSLKNSMISTSINQARKFL